MYSTCKLSNKIHAIQHLRKAACEAQCGFELNANVGVLNANPLTFNIIFSLV